jgi:steroid delta-isomerase-like uncharacterized protein
MRRLYDLINAGDIDGFGRLVADGFIEHEELPGFPPTKAGVIDYFRTLRAAFPDMRMVAEDVIASGNKVVARAVVTGTHKGAFAGIPATGRPVQVKLIDIIRFGDDGQALEHWGVIDQFAMMQQLGVIPPGPSI